MQIWPQYQLENQNRWSEFGTFDFNILLDFTNFLNQNGKWSKVPYIQAFWDLKSCPSLYKDCSTYQILLCSLSPSITKEYKPKAPKRPPKPLAPNFDPTNEPPPYRPRKKASRDETLSSSPSSSKTESDDSKTPKEISTPSPWTRTQSKHVSSQRGSGTRGPYTGSYAFLNFWYEPIEEKLRSFSENPTRLKKKNSSALHKHII